MRNVYLSTGSNLGDRLKNIQSAKELINLRIGNIKLSSHIYETEPWGYVSENKFYNQCLQVETPLSPEELIESICTMEKDASRIKEGSSYSDRTLDIDILFYDKLIMASEKISIPHPRMHLRKFVLAPLNEIAPHFMHPVLNMTVLQLLEACVDKGKIRRITN